MEKSLTTAGRFLTGPTCIADSFDQVVDKGASPCQSRSNHKTQFIFPKIEHPPTASS